MESSSDSKSHVDLRFVSQHVGYPYCIQSNEENDIKGYNSFKKATESCALQVVNKYEQLSFKKKFSII